MKRIGLQLYTVRDLAKEDFIGTLRKVAGIGYHGVEFAGFFGTPAGELRQCLDDLGLMPCASHTAIELLTSQLEETAEYHLQIGVPILIVPALPEKMRRTADEWKQAADTMNRIHGAVTKMGLKLGYHNHDFEFRNMGTETAFDYFTKHLNPDILLEIDFFWAAYAGVDVNRLVRRYHHRMDLVHVKDMGKDAKSTIIGEGTIGYHLLLPQLTSTRWLIVEQEHFRNSCLEDVERGFRYLSSMGESQS